MLHPTPERPRDAVRSLQDGRLRETDTNTQTALAWPRDAHMKVRSANRQVSAALPQNPPAPLSTLCKRFPALTEPAETFPRQPNTFGKELSRVTPFLYSTSSAGVAHGNLQTFMTIAANGVLNPLQTFDAPDGCPNVRRAASYAGRGNNISMKLSANLKSSLRLAPPRARVAMLWVTETTIFANVFGSSTPGARPFS